MKKLAKFLGFGNKKSAPAAASKTPPKAVVKSEAKKGAKAPTPTFAAETKKAVKAPTPTFAPQTKKAVKPEPVKAPTPTFAKPTPKISAPQKVLTAEGWKRLMQKKTSSRK